MNKPTHKFLFHSLISFRVLMLFAFMAVLISCSITPDFQRKHSTNRSIQMISAKRPLVVSCIAQQLKTFSSSSTIIESKESLVLKEGEITIRVYDLEDGVGGTMVTLYGSSSYDMPKALEVLNQCRKQLEAPKPPPQNPAN